MTPAAVSLVNVFIEIQAKRWEQAAEIQVLGVMPQGGLGPREAPETQRSHRRLVLPTAVKPGYTLGMKTAVSIPNELFDVAERLARRTRKSRSRLFSDALREYVNRRSPDRITEAMDQALAEIGEGNDPFVAAASRQRLEQSEW